MDRPLLASRGGRWPVSPLWVSSGRAIGAGGYSAVTQKLGSRIDLLAAPRWFVYHLAGFWTTSPSACCEFVALVLLLSFARRLPRPTALFVAIASAVGVWMLALAAVYATQPMPHPRIYERYVFYLEPLLVLALFVWLREGLPRPRGTRPLRPGGGSAATGDGGFGRCSSVGNGEASF